MKSKVSKFYEVKIQYQEMQEDSKEKKVTEQYVVEALSFTEAETRIIEEMTPYIDGEFDIVSEKIAPYNEIFLSDNYYTDDKWFVSKVAFITIDEKTEKEKKQTFRYLVQAATSELALDYTKEMLSHGMSDYRIDAVQDTPTLDVFLYEVKKEVVETPEENAADNDF